MDGKPPTSSIRATGCSRVRPSADTPCLVHSREEKLPSVDRCHAIDHVPPSRFPTTSTVCSETGPRACCSPLPAGVHRTPATRRRGKPDVDALLTHSAHTLEPPLVSSLSHHSSDAPRVVGAHRDGTRSSRPHDQIPEGKRPCARLHHPVSVRTPRAPERAVGSIHTGGWASGPRALPGLPEGTPTACMYTDSPVVRSTTRRQSARRHGLCGRARDAPASPKARQLHARLLTRCRASSHGVYWSGLLEACRRRPQGRSRPTRAPGGCPWHGRPGDAPIPKDLHITDFATPESTARNGSSRHHRNKPELVGVQAHRG